MARLFTCSMTGVQFSADLPSIGSGAQSSVVHPHINMPVQVAKQALLRVSQYKNIIVTDRDWFPICSMLRLAAYRLSREINCLGDHYTCDQVPLPLTLEADTARDRSIEVHAANVDALCLLALVDKYHRGLPTIAYLELGCFSRLLDSCRAIRDEELQTNAILARIGFDSSIAYQLRIAVPVQPTVFINALGRILHLSDDTKVNLGTSLYHMYLVRKMRIADAPEYSESSYDSIVNCDTTVPEYEMVCSIPQFVRSAELDTSVRDALISASTEYCKMFQPQYDRILSEEYKPKVLVHRPPPFTLKRPTL